MKDSLCLLLLPESDPGAGRETLQRAQPLAARLEARIIAPALTLAEFVRQQIPALAERFVLVASRELPDAEAVTAALANPERKRNAPMLFRSAALRAALRTPLIESDPIYLEVVQAWLQLNLASAEGFDPTSQLPTPRTSSQALALLALVHHFLCRCPLLPDNEALRRLATVSAIKGWLAHRQALPPEACVAVNTVIAQGPRLPLGLRILIRWSQFATRFAPARTTPEVREFAAEIESYVPGLFGGPSLGDPVLQPPT